MKTFTSAVQQRHGEYVMPGRRVAWWVVPGSSYSESVRDMTLSDEVIERIIVLLCRLSVLLESLGARLLMDSEQSVYELSMDDVILVWEDSDGHDISEYSLWPRDVSVTTPGGHCFARLSLTWPVGGEGK